MANIYYVVMSLKLDEVNDAIQKIKDSNMDTVANWLHKHKNNLYDKERDGWKPFMDQPIRDILKVQPPAYQSATRLLEKIDDDASDVTVLQEINIEVYFIDLIALYNNRINKIAKRLDYGLSTKGKCCLIMPYKLSDEIFTVQDQLIQNCRKMWGTVYYNYKKGLPHRIIMMPADLSNFRECILANAEQDAPNLASFNQLLNILGPATHTEVPR